MSVNNVTVDLARLSFDTPESAYLLSTPLLSGSPAGDHSSAASRSTADVSPSIRVIREQTPRGRNRNRQIVPSDDEEDDEEEEGNEQGSSDDERGRRGNALSPLPSRNKPTSGVSTPSKPGRKTQPLPSDDEDSEDEDDSESEKRGPRSGQAQQQQQQAIYRLNGTGSSPTVYGERGSAARPPLHQRHSDSSSNSNQSIGNNGGGGGYMMGQDDYNNNLNLNNNNLSLNNNLNLNNSNNSLNLNGNGNNYQQDVQYYGNGEEFIDDEDNEVLGQHMRHPQAFGAPEGSHLQQLQQMQQYHQAQLAQFQYHHQQQQPQPSKSASHLRPHSQNNYQQQRVSMSGMDLLKQLEQEKADLKRQKPKLNTSDVKIEGLLGRLPEPGSHNISFQQIQQQQNGMRKSRSGQRPVSSYGYLDMPQQHQPSSRSPSPSSGRNQMMYSPQPGYVAAGNAYQYGYLPPTGVPYDYLSTSPNGAAYPRAPTPTGGQQPIYQQYAAPYQQQPQCNY
ncbi:hypothetical protein PHYBLDRAFT_189015 [Phycomyces blakesleeanus NRRL 1555(-)]|uniref:Uncharacterized protein n=1 Tax=Phycomyces blakesleeanus (strain ATCC 8743b / DSM 1359 / FGSC 10004 / NBRC 33097 / NRRL 1555) TaxID=763407 RepID=A0A167K9E3_PHYB8|nr:hypothetical protein PHYBLDRAFT_189015 [Phycomyces blakesleeanus NRRL 1555(-)]OAD67530.1 hypothetical protein PHYBLDRAFT_189015 [Phycomyces blakesleeanus NRRL 1555(-)]|eukprot:XP_018285570.1 hypothetical protein PHYBLDRAFT_189015 [Phycomyces blakesleeanus NRRL 1555(-)]